jgi:hypothetical protein
MPEVIPVDAFIKCIPEQPHFVQRTNYRNETRGKILHGGTMMPRLVSSIHIFERRRNVGEREEELTVNGPEEVFAALHRLIAEIEVVVEMRNLPIERVLLEMLDGV